MSTNLLRDAAILSITVFGGFWAFTHRPIIYEFLGIHPSDFAAGETEAAQSAPQPILVAQKQTGSAISLSKARDGQFWASASVNTTIVKFLVDTGASVVALTPEDAKRAGVDMKTLQYTTPINTASGRTMAAPTTLPKISIGTVAVRNVQAVVIPNGLSHSLLGMSYLGELQKVEVSKNVMILRQ